MSDIHSSGCKSSDDEHKVERSDIYRKKKELVACVFVRFCKVIRVGSEARAKRASWKTHGWLLNGDTAVDVDYDVLGVAGVRTYLDRIGQTTAFCIVLEVGGGEKKLQSVIQLYLVESMIVLCFPVRPKARRVEESPWSRQIQARSGLAPPRGRRGSERWPTWHQ